MTIRALKKKRIIPFECKDTSLPSLFSFFLHKAPTITSASAIDVPWRRLEKNWRSYIGSWQTNQYVFYDRDYFSSKQLLLKHGLSDDTQIERASRSFICTRSNAEEQDYKCVLRHLRNAIAHGHVYLTSDATRKYILLEDYIGKRKTALFLLRQKDLSDLQKTIIR